MNSPQRTRPPLERMLRIHEELKSGAEANCTTLAALCGVSIKTIARDVSFMAERLHLPIKYEANQHSYRYTEPVAAFPTMQVSEGDLFALLVAQKALEQYRGTPFHGQLEQSFEKMTASLQDRISFSPGDGLGAVSFKNIGVGKTDLETFDLLSRGVLKEREVRFDYRKPGDSAVGRRHVQPYHLANRENLWYLVGFDHERKALRTFALPRIARPELLKTRFERPADFSPQKYFASALGALGGDGDHRIVLRFTGAAADRVREREWHESQSMRDLRRGELELTLRLGALPEVLRWVLSWGPEARVIAPKELVVQVRDATRAMAAMYP